MRTTIVCNVPLPKFSPGLTGDGLDGVDGLGGVTSTHPQFTAPSSTWSELFTPPPPAPPSNHPITVAAASASSTNPPLSSDSSQLFAPSTRFAPTEILSILTSHPPDTVSLIALGPLTNFAIAAALDPFTFLRAKEVLVMGGAISVAGNITPAGEFNILADPLAAARVLALTSPNPASTFPTARAVYGAAKQELPRYPSLKTLGDKRLNLTLFPLDITMKSVLQEQHVLPPNGSPLKDWVYAFTSPTFELNKRLNKGAEAEMALHDPLVVWFGISSGIPGWEIVKDQDVRIETEGQWTRGMCVTDQRGRKQLIEAEELKGSLEEVNGDMGSWLSRFRGNRVSVCVAAPGGPDGLARELVRKLF